MVPAVENSKFFCVLVAEKLTTWNEGQTVTMEIKSTGNCIQNPIKPVPVIKLYSNLINSRKCVVPSLHESGLFWVIPG